MSSAQSPAQRQRFRLLRLLLAALIAAFLLWVALLSLPPLPHVVHQVLHAVLPPHSRAVAGTSLLATVLRKLPEDLLYFLLALLLRPSRPWRIWTFLAVAGYGLGLELLRPLHAGRSFEPWDVAYEAIAALLGVYLPVLLLSRSRGPSSPGDVVR